jgi:hypothetical protein
MCKLALQKLHARRRGWLVRLWPELLSLDSQLLPALRLSR